MIQQQQSLVINDDILVELALESKSLTREQVDVVRARQAELLQGGVRLTLGQVMLERKLLTISQLKQLMQELERRMTQQPQPKKPTMASAKDQLNTRFGDYLLLEILADTARYRMFKAQHTVQNQLFALKVLPPNITKDAVWYERFKREVLLAKVLSHPNIIRTYGTGEIDGCPVMVQEYVEGLTLSERLAREGNFPEKTAWLMGREIAKALAYAAQIGIIHRDIKPDNIVCSRSGVVKIVDMGLSKAMGDDTGLTAPGTTVGTPFYISPEQARGNKDIDGRTDIYSLGCTIFHMLTGSVPFMGEVLTDVMLAHIKAPRPDPRTILPEISEASAQTVMRMMAIKPQDRFADAEALVLELDKLIKVLPEPDAFLRPVQAVAPSDFEMSPEAKAAAEQRAAEKKAAPVPQPMPKVSWFTRLTDWLYSLLAR
ncbi:MAG TPA: serine/threonine-protein kinase [Planctomycetota bacterium]|nr:serine/threonine-protein kinase [Planctomycetota bacterium]